MEKNNIEIMIKDEYAFIIDRISCLEVKIIGPIEVDFMNKIAIQNGLAYIIERLSDTEVKITGPSTKKDKRPIEYTLSADIENRMLILSGQNQEDDLIEIDNDDSVDKVFNDFIDMMTEQFCQKTKFVYIKENDKYTMIGDL